MQKILFDHIPKTGGSALHAVFMKWYGDDQVTPQLKGPRLREALIEYESLAVISGHIRFLPGDILPTNRLKVTVYRDPVDRALSSYFFDRNHVSGTTTHDVELAKTYDVNDFFLLNEPIFLDGFSNIQTRHFASYCDDFNTSEKPLSDDDLLRLARKTLKQFDVVGNYLNFEDFVAIVGIEAGIHQWEMIPKVNVTSGRIKAEALKPKVLKRLRHINELDIALGEEINLIFSETRTRVLKLCVGHRAAVAALPDFIERKGGSKPSSPATISKIIDFGSREIEILAILTKGSISCGSHVLSGEEISISVVLQAHQSANDLTIGLHISEASGARVFAINSRLLGVVLSITSPGQTLVHFKMKCELGLGEYHVGASIHKGNTHLEKCYHWREYCSIFHVAGQLGNYFEGKFRLYPSISFEGGEDYPSMFELIETGISYPRSIMLQSAVLSSFSIKFQIDDSSYQPKGGEIFNLICCVTNTGSQMWPVAGTRPVCISYHWIDRNRNPVIFEGLRTRLSGNFRPSQSEVTPIQIQTPYESGDYILQMTAVQEGVAWFDEKGCTPPELPFTVID